MPPCTKDHQEKDEARNLVEKKVPGPLWSISFPFVTPSRNDGSQKGTRAKLTMPTITITEELPLELSSDSDLSVSVGEEVLEVDVFVAVALVVVVVVVVTAPGLGAIVMD